MVELPADVAKAVLKVIEEVKSGGDSLKAGRKLIELAPDLGTGYMLVGMELQQRGQAAESETWLWKALAAEPCRAETYFALQDALNQRRATALADQARTLALRQLSLKTEIPDMVVKSFSNEFPKNAPLDLHDPSSYAVMASLSGKDVVYSAEFEPYHWLALLQEGAQEELDPDDLTTLLGESERLNPVLHAAVRHWVRRSPEASDGKATAFAIALLGETGGVSLLEDLFEISRFDDSETFLHAHWALARLGRRFPAEILFVWRKLAAAQPDAPERCGIAEHLLATLRQGDQDPKILLEVLQGFDAVSSHGDTPYLLAAVVKGLRILGQPETADRVFAEYSRRLPREGRRWLAKHGDEFVPLLDAENLGDFTIEDLVVDRVLLEDEDDSDEDDLDKDKDHAPYVAPPAIGRNDPCWCGSGKKYKKCHMEEDERSGPGEPETQSLRLRLYEQIVDAAEELQSRTDVGQAYELYYGLSPEEVGPDPEDAEAFFEWYLFDFRSPSTDRTPIEAYLRRHGHEHNTEERQILKAWTATRYGLYEVTGVEPGEGVELRDIFTGESWLVHDRPASGTFDPGDFIGARIETVAGRHAFPTDPLLVPEDEKVAFIAGVRADAEVARQAPAAYVRTRSHRVARRLWKLTGGRGD